MKNFFKVTLLFVIAGLALSCNKDDGNDVAPLRDYAEQYATDLATIKTFLKTHSMSTPLNHPGLPDDQDVTFTSVPELDPSSIWGTDPNTHNANVLEWPVVKDGFTYIIYYIQLRQGSGPNSISPCNYDSILAAYTGWLVEDTTNPFQTNNFPNEPFALTGVIRAWSEIFPKFKTGTRVSNSDGTVGYYNFGAGVMFVPSGLAYYANPPSGNIPSYSPLIFNFKLYTVQRNDNDGDGIYSYEEDLNNDGYIRDYDITGSYEDDTDHDGVPNALDIDDDGDGTITKNEIKYTLSGNTYYYPFNGALVDDPATPQDETKGVPRAFTGPLAPVTVPPSTTPVMLPSPGAGDYTDPLRLRRYLDPNAKPPYYDQH